MGIPLVSVTPATAGAGHNAISPPDWDTLATSYGSPVGKTDYVVNSSTQFNAAMSTAVPGDRIMIANGAYTAGDWKASASGSVTLPILIMGQDPGVFSSRKANFSGGAHIQVTGSNLVMGGIDGTWTDDFFGKFRLTGASDNWFVDMDLGINDTNATYVVQVERNSDRNIFDRIRFHGPGSRLFRQQVESGRTGTYDDLNGPCVDNVVKFCTFENTARIGGGSGQSCIQIGQYPEHRILSNRFTIENCWFRDNFNFGGEFKSSGNIFRYNVLSNMTGFAGWLQRSGIGNKIYGNLFYDVWNGCQLVDADHMFYNNILINVNGDFGISMVKGADPASTTIRAHFPMANNTTVARNIIYNFAKYGIELGRDQVSDHGETMPDPPENCNFLQNVMITDIGRRMMYNRAEGSPAHTFDRNSFFTTTSVPDGSADGVTWTDANKQTGTSAGYDALYLMSASSVLKGAGVAINNINDDYYGRALNSPPDRGATAYYDGATRTTRTAFPGASLA